MEPSESQPDRSAERHDVAALHEPILRERAEPREGFEPAPWWLVGVMVLAVFWAGWYLATHHGGFRGDILDPDAGLGGDEAASLDPVVRGQRLYRGNCAACHLLNGQGVPNQYPPLAGSDWVLGPPQRLARVLLHGLEGRIVVSGRSYQGNMPALGRQLSDREIADVLTYIRQAWGNRAPPVSAAEVAAARQRSAGRRMPWQMAELEGLEPDLAHPTTPPATQPAETPAPAQSPQPAGQPGA